MCGIAGYINLDGRPLARETAAPLLTAMGDAIHHRGPDDTRIMLWENVGFVFKRLSIVDIAGGAQPFETADGSVCAMVNGAIYNHREIRPDLARSHTLRTQSDCEVIPYLYLERGLGLFDTVNGMFAVALLDRRKRRVLLGRDRTGVKPLLYCIADGGRVLVFASELKGLFAHPAVPRVFDWQAFTPEGRAAIAGRADFQSGFAGIESVPPAALVDVDLRRGTVATHRYWSLPAHDEPSVYRTEQYYVDWYRALLEDSVRLRLMADVGYGLFLSGGVDSSIIAAIAARAGPFPTFSVLSRSTAGSGDAEAAHDVAAALGLPNHQVHFDEATIDISPDDWRRILWHCEMPHVTAEQLFKFYLHAFARERHPGLKVMLLGQGSDEFNGGYLSLVLGRGGSGRTVSFMARLECGGRASAHRHRIPGDALQRGARESVPERVAPPGLGLCAGGCGPTRSAHDVGALRCALSRESRNPPVARRPHGSGSFDREPRPVPRLPTGRVPRARAGGTPRGALREQADSAACRRNPPAKTIRVSAERILLLWSAGGTRVPHDVRDPAAQRRRADRTGDCRIRSNERAARA